MKQVSEFNYSANLKHEVLGDITVRVEPIEDSVAQASFSIEKNGEDLVTGRIISDRGYDIDEGVSNSYREQEWQSYVDSVADEDEVDLIHAILKMAYVVANEPAKPMCTTAIEGQETLPIVDDLLSEGCALKEAITDVWGFVERYYPNYYNAQEIADADDLQKIIDDEMEEGSAAYTSWIEEYEEDMSCVKQDYEAIHRSVYEKAIQGYLDSLKG